MAAPTAPTLTSLTTEALKRAGYSDPANDTNAPLTRSQDEWMEEIKNDLWREGYKLRSLKTYWIQATTNGVSKYSLPSDFFRMVAKVNLLHGQYYGTAQAGGASSITLAADETAGATWIIGREIVIYSGTGSGQKAQVSAYDSTTKVATISPAWATQPDATSLYMIVDDYYELDQIEDADYQRLADPGDKGLPPIGYFLEEDSDYGNIRFDSAPYDASVVYVIYAEYYANLMTLDLAGTLMSLLYQKWRNLWIQGVFYRALQDMDDDRAEREQRLYLGLLKSVLKKEKVDSGREITPGIESCYPM